MLVRLASESMIQAAKMLFAIDENNTRLEAR